MEGPGLPGRMAAAPFDAFGWAHAHRTEVAWLSQNTNHLVPPEVVQPAILEAVRERRYEGYPPAAGLPELRERVREDLGLPEGTGLLLSAGATESLYMATRALLHPGDEVIASDPSYLIIHRFIELAGGVVRPLDIYAPPYKLTAERVAAAVSPATRMVLLIDPLNPLGSGYSAEEVRAIAGVARDHGLYLVHDVTYRDFAPGHTLAAGVYPERTLTMWSCSKNCGLAGMRLGGLAASAELAKEVGRFNTNDLGVNILAQVAALAALSTKSRWFDAVRATTRANQDRIRAAVRSTPDTFLPVFPSAANMFVIDLSATGVSPEALQRELLLRHGVFVRAGNYLSKTHGHRFVRVSFSNPPEDVERFVRTFPSTVEALRRSATTAGPAAASGARAASPS